MHTSRTDDRCENATLHHCVCHDCGGRLHKWPSLITLTLADESARELWGASRKNRWRRREAIDRERLASVARTKATLARSNPKRNKSAVARYHSSLRSLAQKRSSIEAQAAASDIITFRAIEELSKVEHTDRMERVRTVLETLGGALTTLLESGSADWHDAAYRSGFAGSHVWCATLTAIANAPSDEARVAMDEAMRQDVHVVQMDEAVFTAVTNSIDRTRTAAGAPDIESLQEVLRIAALFICPAPEGHQSLVQNGLTALSEDLLAKAPNVSLAMEFLLTKAKR